MKTRGFFQLIPTSGILCTPVPLLSFTCIFDPRLPPPPPPHHHRRRRRRRLVFHGFPDAASGHVMARAVFFSAAARQQAIDAEETQRTRRLAALTEITFEQIAEHYGAE